MRTDACHLRLLQFLPLSFACLCASSFAAPEAIRLDATPAELRFGNGVVELTFDRATGNWRGLTDKASGLNALTSASTNLGVDGKPLLQPDRSLTYRSHRSEAEGEAKVLSIVSTLGDWELTARYTLWPGQDLVRRDAEFVYRGPSFGAGLPTAPPAPANRSPEAGRDTSRSGEKGRSGDLPRTSAPPPAIAKNMQFVLSGLCLGEASDNAYTILAAYPPETRPFADLQPGRRVGEPWSGSCARCVAVHNARRQLTLVTLFLSETETAGAFVEEGKDSISITQSLWLTDYAQPGRRIAGGSQFVRLVRGSWPDALRATQDICRFIPLDAPPDAPPNADKAVIYSAHPGGTIDSGFRDVGGFQNFSRMIPYLASLGVDTLWLVPFWQGPVYAPNDYYKLDARLGTPEDLSALTALAHKHGMRVLGDLIPHGPRDESGLHNEHPDWICRDPDGKMIYWWGCLYCDYAHPGWQRYMADHAAYWVKSCGLDGYRVDVAGGGPPNWQPHGDNRPSHSGLAGGLQLMAEARKACKQHNPNAVILPEAAGPAFFRTGDFVYDMMFGHFILPNALKESPADFVAHVSQWLEYQQYYYPPHARLMRFLENHDTVRARLRYGVGLHRALLALCAFSKGVPFLYHEQEIGDGPFLRSLYRIRERYPQLAKGEASYTAVQSSAPGVLTILRQLGDRRAVVAINFNPHEVTADLRVPFDLPKGWRLSNVLVGEELEEGFLSLPAGRLPPYGLGVFIPKEAQDEMVGWGYTSVPLAAGFKESPDAIVLSGKHFRVALDKRRGGLMKRWEDQEGDLLTEMTLKEGARKLFVGAEPMDFAAVRDLRVTTDMGESRKEVVFSGTLCREMGGAREPVLNYRLRYVIQDLVESPVERGRLQFRCELEPLVDTGLAKSELALRLRLQPRSRWFARTFEGLLYDECLFRHPSASGFRIRYWHESGAHFWQSRLLPLDPKSPDFGLWAERSGSQWLFRPGGARHVAISEDKEPGTPNVIGDPAGLQFVFTYFDGEQAVVLRRGQTHSLGFDAILRSFGDLWSLYRRSQRGQEARPGDVAYWAEGANYVFQNQHFRAAVLRSAGAQLRELTPLGAGAKPAGTSLIVGSECYTDKGLYGKWKDPLGVEHETSANNQSDVEPDVSLEEKPDGLAMTFTSCFRHPYGGGRSVLNPRTWYRLGYEFNKSQKMRVRCGVRPMITKTEVRGFLAHILRLRDVAAWAVETEAGRPLEWKLTSPTEPLKRVWESRRSGGVPLAVWVRGKDGHGLRFADFSAVRAVPTKSAARFDFTIGKFFRAARPEADRAHSAPYIAALQNLFLLDNGKGSVVLFFAFLDGEPTEVTPVWREIGYSMQVTSGE